MSAALAYREFIATALRALTYEGVGGAVVFAEVQAVGGAYTREEVVRLASHPPVAHVAIMRMDVDTTDLLPMATMHMSIVLLTDDMCLPPLLRDEALITVQERVLRGLVDVGWWSWAIPGDVLVAAPMAIRASNMYRFDVDDHGVALASVEFSQRIALFEIDPGAYNDLLRINHKITQPGDDLVSIEGWVPGLEGVDD